MNKTDNRTMSLLLAVGAFFIVAQALKLIAVLITNDTNMYVAGGFLTISIFWLFAGCRQIYPLHWGWLPVLVLAEVLFALV